MFSKNMCKYPSRLEKLAHVININRFRKSREVRRLAVLQPGLRPRPGHVFVYATMQRHRGAVDRKNLHHRWKTVGFWCNCKYFAISSWRVRGRIIRHIRPYIRPPAKTLKWFKSEGMFYFGCLCKWNSRKPADNNVWRQCPWKPRAWNVL